MLNVNHAVNLSNFIDWLEKSLHKSSSMNIIIFYFADYWPWQKFTCLYGLEMRNNAAHLSPYHFQNLSYLLGRLGTRVQYNVKGRSSPRDRRYLQTACFETPIYMNFFRLKDFEFGKKMFSTSQIFLMYLNKRILWMIWPVNSNDCELTIHPRLLSSKTFSMSGLHGFFFSVFGYTLSLVDRVIVKPL